MFPINTQELVSSGTRDSDLDGFSEWRATVRRELPPPTQAVTPSGPRVADPPPLPTHVEVEEHDPVSQLLVRRMRSFFRSDDTSHVTIEADTGAGLQTVADWEARSDAPLQPWETAVPCPPGFAQDVVDVMTAAAANGGKCLQANLLFAEAADMAKTIATRKFLVSCRKGTNATGGGTAAAVHTGSAEDPIRPIVVFVNLDWWAVGNRERVLFHELMHASSLYKHNPDLQFLKNQDEARWRELDRVDSCESLCYNSANATKCECATCRGAKTCGSCANLKACASDQLKAYCVCEKKPFWYATDTICREDCPSGFSCFVSQCRTDANVCK